MKAHLLLLFFIYVNSLNIQRSFHRRHHQSVLGKCEKDDCLSCVQENGCEYVDTEDVGHRCRETSNAVPQFGGTIRKNIDECNVPISTAVMKKLVECNNRPKVFGPEVLFSDIDLFQGVKVPEDWTKQKMPLPEYKTRKTMPPLDFFCFPGYAMGKQEDDTQINFYEATCDIIESVDMKLGYKKVMELFSKGREDMAYTLKHDTTVGFGVRRTDDKFEAQTPYKSAKYWRYGYLARDLYFIGLNMMDDGVVTSPDAYNTRSFIIFKDGGLQLAYKMPMTGDIKTVLHIETEFTKSWYNIAPSEFPPLEEEAERYFDLAMKADTVNDIVKYASNCYWMLITVMPYKRGTAAIGLMLLAGIFREKGLVVSGWNKGIAPDLEAYTFPIDQFECRFPKMLTITKNNSS